MTDPQRDRAALPSPADASRIERAQTSLSTQIEDRMLIEVADKLAELSALLGDEAGEGTS